MGIYPRYSTVDRVREPDGRERWEEQRHEPGVVFSRKVVATAWVEKERTDCYCCSCGDREGSDPYCRNHGWVGRRPCEKHNLPGATDDEGVMPASVQAERARLREIEEKYRDR